GEVLYRHREEAAQQLVPPYVAAAMTDLMQTAVNIGTGRAAQIGRPVAGKTGTTSSNKDGWFLGFSSGITTGVWMGRDDAKAVPGLQGGAAPARAFAAYMKVATRKRPVEQFDTELKLPQWQLEPDDEAMQGNPDDYFYVDEQGNLVDPSRRSRQPEEPAFDPDAPPEGVPPDVPQAANDDFLNRATGRRDNDAGYGPPPRPRPTNPPRPVPNY
ncbi:MAG: penicillin-binding transpeptidase domain-containing protein, partial [Novosphingobium sp.]